MPYPGATSATPARGPQATADARFSDIFLASARKPAPHPDARRPQQDEDAGREKVQGESGAASSDAATDPSRDATREPGGDGPQDAPRSHPDDSPDREAGQPDGSGTLGRTDVQAAPVPAGPQATAPADPAAATGAPRPGGPVLPPRLTGIAATAAGAPPDRSPGAGANAAPGAAAFADGESQARGGAGTGSILAALDPAASGWVPDGPDAATAGMAEAAGMAAMGPAPRSIRASPTIAAAGRAARDAQSGSPDLPVGGPPPAGTGVPAPEGDSRRADPLSAGPAGLPATVASLPPAMPPDAATLPATRFAARLASQAMADRGDATGSDLSGSRAGTLAAAAAGDLPVATMAQSVPDVGAKPTPGAPIAPATDDAEAAAADSPFAPPVDRRGAASDPASAAATVRSHGTGHAGTLPGGDRTADGVRSDGGAAGGGALDGRALDGGVPDGGALAGAVPGSSAPLGAGTAPGQTTPTHALGPMIASAASRGEGTLDVALAPEELGRVTFHLQPRGDRIHVVLVAERTETMDLMRRSVDQFAADLRAAGFADASFSFSGRAGQGGASGGRTPAPPDGIGRAAQQDPSARAAPP